MTDNLENYHKAPVPTCKTTPYVGAERREISRETKEGREQSEKDFYKKAVPMMEPEPQPYPAIEDNEQDWNGVMAQRDFHRELVGRANENIIACERALKAAKYYVHKMRLGKYKAAVANGECHEEVGKHYYEKAMQNYDVIIDLNFKGKGGGEHNDECVKKGWEDEG